MTLNEIFFDTVNKDVAIYTQVYTEANLNKDIQRYLKPYLFEETRE